MKKAVSYLFTLIWGFIFFSSLNSCVSTKQLAYFNSVPRDSTIKIQGQLLETVISKSDVLQIIFSTLDPITTATLNSVNPGNSGIISSNAVTGGYLVDETGIIKLPLIGSVKAEGLTKRQLASVITELVLTKKIALDPIVTVRIISYKITVLGEVNRPGVIPVPNEHITLPEALGAAGDLTIYGKRTNITLIREVGDKRIFKHFSLNSDQLFDKDIYNLQNQDVIYVEPNKARASTADITTQLLPTALSVISLIIVLYVQLRN